MTDLEYEKFYKRYDKFKKNILPELFWDDERQVREYVYYSSRGVEVSNDIVKSLEEITQAGLYYSFTTKIIYWEKLGDTLCKKSKIGYHHAHSFNEVVENLYNFPESFEITKEDEVYYSKQELKYLNRIKKYFLFLGMKDIEDFNDKERYKNPKYKKYIGLKILKLSNDDIKLAISKEKKFMAFNYIENFSSEKVYNEKEYRALIVDEDDNFKLFIEFTHSEIKNYEEIKELCGSIELNNEEKVEIRYFKILEIF